MNSTHRTAHPITEALRDVAAVGWLCIYPIGCTMLGLTVLLWLDQGREVLLAIHDYGGDKQWWLWFFLAVGTWGLSAWYSARVLLNSRAAGGRLAANTRRVRVLRVWLPRVLGTAAFLPLAWRYWQLTDSFFPALPLAALGVLFLILLVRRRPWSNRLAASRLARRLLTPAVRAALRLAPATRIEARVRGSTLAVCAVALALSLALLLWFVQSPVTGPRQVGAAAIVLFALSSWILVGSLLLVLWPRIVGWPSLALLPLLSAGIVSFWNDNHELRPLAAIGGTQQECFEEACVERAFIEWFRARRPRVAGKVPVIVVAAAGGGQRAAYWTAQSLALLEDASGGKFSEHVFAISGVSGGSLGAATFSALVSRRPRIQPGDMNACASEFLAEDFLSPVLASLLFPDLIQQLMLPFPVAAFDRARTLEASWAHSWSDVVGDGSANPFSAAFDELWRGERRLRVPALFLNATVVENGQRLLVSSIPGGRDEFTDTMYVFDPRLDTWPLSLASATHLSARFSYISPAATLRQARTGTAWGRVVDGAYHENSGALTAAEIVRVIERAVQRGAVARNHIAVYALIITNSSDDPRLCAAPADHEPLRFLHEARDPLRALLATRDARGSFSRTALAIAARGFLPADRDCGCQPGSWCNTFELAMPDIEARPATGWFLSARSRAAMDAAILAGENRAAFLGLVRAVTGRTEEPDAGAYTGVCRLGPR